MLADNKQEALQDIMAGELFAGGSKGDMVETLKFMEKHGTPISPDQVAGISLLKMLEHNRSHKEFDPIIDAVMNMRLNVTPSSVFMDVIEAVTLGGMVTGKVRASKFFGGEGK